MMNEIRLLEQNGQVLTLPVTAQQQPYGAERILAATGHLGVRENQHYDLELPQVGAATDVTVTLNGKPLNGMYDRRHRQVLFSYPIFAYHMGLVELEITLQQEDGSTATYYTDLLPVLIQPSARQQNLAAMLEFVYDHQAPLLTGSSLQAGESGFQDFLSQLTLAEEILQVYEENYGYFKANCRHTLETEEVVDWTEKVQTVNSHTLQYLVRHPEYLRKAPYGVDCGGGHYLPEKLLMTQDKMSRDVYENQVVLSFLQRLCYDLEEERKEISEALDRLQLPGPSADGYLLSSEVLYENAAKLLRGFLDRCSEVEERLQEMFVSYQQILPVTLLDASQLPVPTEPFFRVPQYYRIYLCIHKWYQNATHHFPRERMLLNLYENTFVFEIYCLVKLLDLAQQAGYKLTGSRRQAYSVGQRGFYSAGGYRNVFTLEKDGATLTLYFHPVLTDRDESAQTGIHLYRNSTYAFKALEEGHYYTPDYLLRWKGEGKENYLVLDAKYSYKKKVLQELMPEMSYKYLLSLSPIAYEEEGRPVQVAMKGLEILYGLTNGDQRLESFYNCQLPGSTITPAANAVPCSEEVEPENQRQNMAELLREIEG